MSDHLQTINTFASNQIDAMSAVAGVFARSAEKIVAETKDFSVAAYRNQSALITKLVSAKSLLEVMQASSEHAKAHYDVSIGETKKLGAIFTDLAADAVKTALKTAPAETAAKAAPKAEPAKREHDKAGLVNAEPAKPSLGAPQLVKPHPRAAQRGAA